MIFRVISNQGRKRSAYGLFAVAEQMFAAILEDPSGSGRTYLVSRAGRREAITQAKCCDAQAYFRDWQGSVQAQRYQSPAIRMLFYAAYEAGGLIESLPEPKSVVPGPILWRLEPDFSICFTDEQIHLAARNEPAMAQAMALLEGATQQQPEYLPCQYGELNVTASAAYRQAVASVKQYIAAGDVFQANIARFWRCTFKADALPALYARLRQVNPAPFSCAVRIESDAGDLHLLSASPERLFRLDPENRADTRPIAGTRRRGDGERDDSLRNEMLLSEKERAEHIMLVDLERNDLGRVCRPGSVEVDERMVVEQYATVQHIVSNVRGDLEDRMDLVDLFRAMFPGGTITGCPKVRCMEIIHELEGNARGPYTGGIGYQAWDGSADMNILIRTFWHYEGELHWAAGAGIVADSDPERELIETGHKAEGLIRALA